LVWSSSDLDFGAGVHLTTEVRSLIGSSLVGYLAVSNFGGISIKFPCVAQGLSVLGLKIIELLLDG
jgi:hypothetical protein